jgi:peptidoglycan/LPS O-acetylase OafA/YrhL
MLLDSTSITYIVLSTFSEVICMQQYRTELDGLRALSVVAVIIYHANIQILGFQIFKGGFFGVDVFLILSGYLITGIIRGKMESGGFSFFDFYWRRAKRIVPALLVMLLVTTLFAYFFLLPDGLVTYAKSLLSALHFGSNYYFYGEDSYTASASIYKPLLHTWSLALEWQFYIVYPLIVWFLNKFFKQYVFGALFILALISLQYANFIVPSQPDLAFYLLPTRAWELIFGGLVTFFNREHLINAVKGSLEYFIYKSLPLIGLFLVIHSLLFVGHEILHPSFLTVIPVLGTCLFLMFSHKGEVTNDLLSTRVFVFIGLISYSLYLWHQPVFVFFRVLKNDDFSPEQLLLLSVITIVLSIFTYRLVECKYRARKISVGLIIILLTSFFVLGASALYIIKHNGFIDDYNKVVTESSMIILHGDSQGMNYGGDLISSCNGRLISDACEFLNSDVIIVGDSFAYQYDKPMYDYLLSHNKGLATYNFQQCPFVTSDIYFTPEICSLVNEDRWKKILTLTEKKVFILAAYYTAFDNPKKRIDIGVGKAIGSKPSVGDILEKDIAWKSYANNINRLIDLGHKVIVIYPYPFPDINAKMEFIREFKKNKSKGSSIQERHIKDPAPQLKLIKAQTAKLDKYLLNKEIIKVHPVNSLCVNNICKSYDNGGSIYHDWSHLSYYGTSLVIDNDLKPILDKILNIR